MDLLPYRRQAHRCCPIRALRISPQDDGSIDGYDVTLRHYDFTYHSQHVIGQTGSQDLNPDACISGMNAHLIDRRIKDLPVKIPLDTGTQVCLGVIPITAEAAPEHR